MQRSHLARLKHDLKRSSNREGGDIGKERIISGKSKKYQLKNIMTSDLHFWEVTLIQGILSISQHLNRITPQTEAFERSIWVQHAEESLKHAEEAKRSFKLEVRLIQDSKEHRIAVEALQKLSQDLELLKEELVKFEYDKIEEELDPTTRAGDILLGEATTVQDKTQDSLSTIKSIIADSKENSGMDYFREQTRTIKRIENKSDDVNYKLIRSEKLLKRFRHFIIK
jgi:hypothetical protein